jgi:DNA-binding GntR family transcriptional regulator
MKEPLFSQITPFSKKDRVVAAIREAVVSGRMRPGDPIVESRVARQLGVGQPVVREALLDLEHSGFVQRVPHRGTTVTKLGPGEIEQIQRLRIELESLAVAWAKGRATALDLEDLRAIVGEMRQAGVDSDLSKFNDCDLAFHRKVWQLSGNKYLCDALERAVVPLLTFFYLKSGTIGELHLKSVDHHAALVEAFASNDPSPAGAREALQALKTQCETLAGEHGEPAPVDLDIARQSKKP